MKQIKVVIIFEVCLAFLPSNAGYQEVSDKMKEMNMNNETINGVFRPSKDGYLGGGIFGVVYKGTMIPVEKQVAMKFTDTSNCFAIQNAAKEYAIYSYLNAIHDNNYDSNVELYGIPTIYYYGRWDRFILMALTLFDTTVKSKSKTKSNELDVLIIFREFVRISKYIHSRGIVHNDINLENMMFRRSQGFLIDFNIAKKMNRHANKDERSCAKDDWKRFFYSMCSFCGVSWFAIDYTHIQITDKQIKSDALRRVFIEFANNTFDDGKTSKDITILYYDRIYQIICEEIKRNYPAQPALVSWINDEDVSKAIQELTEIPKISSIDDPFGVVEPQYSDTNFSHFFKHTEHINVDEAFQKNPFNLGTKHTNLENHFRKSLSFGSKQKRK